jgi:outer membrane receptor protein involved in Fe transport
VRLERAPKWTWSLLADYQRPVGAGLTLEAMVNVTYEGETTLQPDFDPLDMQKAYAKLNARIALTSEAGWEVALVGRNLTDEIVKNFAFDTPFFGGGAHTASIAPRRTLLIEASYRFR